MGTWGVGILSGDTASAVHQDYINYYDDGLDHAVIKAEIEKSYSEEFEDFNDGPVVWFALAQAQWDCGALAPDVLKRVTEIIELGADLESWDEEETVRQRRGVLLRFLRKLQNPRTKPLLRRKRPYRPAIYQPGDCLAVTLTNGSYGAALVLASDQPRYASGQNLVGVLAYNSSVKPDLSVFEQVGWLYLSHHSHSGKDPFILWCPANLHKKAQPLELVGRIALRDDDPKEWPVLGGWVFALQIEMQAQWDQRG